MVKKMECLSSKSDSTTQAECSWGNDLISLSLSSCFYRIGTIIVEPTSWDCCRYLCEVIIIALRLKYLEVHYL